MTYLDVLLVKFSHAVKLAQIKLELDIALKEGAVLNIDTLVKWSSQAQSARHCPLPIEQQLSGYW